MISRRQLRIKVLQTTYAYYKGDKQDIARAEKELHFNIQKTYDLYHYLFLLLIDIVLYAESRIEIARNKLVPTEDDLNPNLRFVNNRVIEHIRNSDQLLKYVDQRKLNWANYPELIKELYSEIIQDEVFKRYMHSEESDILEDRKLLGHVLSNIILLNESMDQCLEEQSIYWNDDIEFTVSMMLKTLKRIDADSPNDNFLLDLFKNSEDEDFAVDLLRKTIVKKDEAIGYIKSNTRNWDVERIAFMDILIMQMAVAELMSFPSIPTKVTLNEYLEISKIYSTNKSSVFINGVLDKVVGDLKEEKKIRKSGRGLIGEYDNKK